MCHEQDHQRTQRTRREFLVGATLTATSLLMPADHTSADTSTGRGSQAMGKSITQLPSAKAMASAAEALLKTLSAEQRAKMAMGVNEEERYNWHFVPKVRKGLPLKELDPAQRERARALLSAGLSKPGLTKATTIIELENVLKEIEKSGPVRDPELYYFTVFGQPQSRGAWGWRVEGHHLSLNYMLMGDKQISITPAFFGANPAEVRHGARKGLRALAGEEDQARLLLKSLDGPQRTEAVISDTAPRDILTGNNRRASPLDPAGLMSNKISDKQKDVLMNLLNVYASRMPADIARARMEKLRAAGFDRISFAWAGDSEPGRAHYYRIQGPTFLIEYDNIQNNANHIHTVWRDFTGDFGSDLLAMHYKNAHR